MVTLNKKINMLRKDIDSIDRDIMIKLKQRIQLTEKIGKIKKAKKSDILDEKRETEIFEGLLTAAKEYEIDDDFIIAIWRQIIEHSYKIQEESK